MKTCFFCEKEKEKGTIDKRGVFACEECFTSWMAKSWNKAIKDRLNLPGYAEKVKRVYQRIAGKF